MNIRISKGRLISLSVIICQLSFSAALLTLTACSDWSDHFDEAGITASTVDEFGGDIVSYMKQATDAKKYDQLLQENGIYDNIDASRQYTLIICNDQAFGDGGTIASRTSQAAHSVSDLVFTPNDLKEGTGILTRSGKNIWVYGQQPNINLEGHAVVKTVKTQNGYVYYVDGIIPLRPSAYEYLKSLGSEYSRFKELVANTEDTIFDREHSQPIGVNKEGMVVYDSVKIVRNELMDRYTQEGIATWNMRDESYVTTMFIPTNEQIDRAVETALDSVQRWNAVTDEYGRVKTTFDEATRARYKQKFENWIVRACFVDRRLTDAEVAADAADIKCVGDYQKVVNEVEDMTYYSQANVEAANWRPSVQTVDVSKKVALSNGTAYFCTNLKIPNHVVIYRLKSKFYQIWDAFGGDESLQAKYFSWYNMATPMIVRDAQGEFMLNDNMPIMKYDVLTAEPDTLRIDPVEGDTTVVYDPCGVTYQGLMYVDKEVNPDIPTSTYIECNAPAGEYYLRMGFKHSLQYSLSIWFEDSLIVKDMVMYAQGSNFHFDRGSAAPSPHYGEQGIGYAEGFDPNYWMQKDFKAIAYDTDGYTVGIVRLNHSGNFHIKVESSDMARIYVPGASRNKNNVKQLMMYHWCLRPTKNNY